MNRSRSIIILVGGGGGNECINRRGLNTTIATQILFNSGTFATGECQQMQTVITDVDGLFRSF